MGGIIEGLDAPAPSRRRAQLPWRCSFRRDDVAEALSLTFLALARPTYAAITQWVVFVALKHVLHHPDPWRRACAFFTVWSSLSDALSIGSVVLAIGIAEALAGAPRRTMRADVAAAAAGCAALLLIGTLGGSAASLLVYGFASGAPPPWTPHRLPPWAVLFSATVWPCLFAVAAVATYAVQLLPRLEALVGTRAAIAAVSLSWAFEAVTLPWTPGERAFNAYRFLAALPLTTALTTAWWRTQRTLPIAGAAAAALAVAVVVAALQPRDSLRRPYG